jgi:hypothetical protein|nr:MAG TPA: hypothetical protein [Caudoviricetes sp.]
MKTKDNIQKVINLNAFIYDMSKDYEILTYAESYMFYSYVEYNKIHTLLYHDYDVHIFVQGDNYCFITVKGTHKEYNSLNDFIKSLNRYLDLLYLLDKIIYGY